MDSPLIIFLGVIALILLVGTALKKQYRKKLEQIRFVLLAGWQSEIITNKMLGGLSSTVKIVAQRGDDKLEMWTIPGGKSRPPQHYLFIEHPSHYDIMVTREYFSHRIGKKLGMAKEIQLGNEELDKHFYIKAPDEMTSRNLVDSSVFRDALRVFKEDKYFNSFEVCPSSLEQRQSPFFSTSARYYIANRSGCILGRRGPIPNPEKYQDLFRQQLNAILALSRKLT